MKIRYGIGAALSTLLMASAVSAASLSIVGGTDVVLQSNHNPAGIAAPVGQGDTIKAFGGHPFYEQFDGSNGLHLDQAANVTITFLGKEAAAPNTVMSFSGGTLSNNGAVGSSITSLDLPDWVFLSFDTFGATNPALLRGTIANNTGSAGFDLSDQMAIGYYLESSKVAYAFLGDGRGDDDFDDMVVRISIVPLPAGGLLLLTALGGFAVARRKKSA